MIMHNLHNEINKSHEQTYYIDFIFEDNLYKVKSYDLFLIYSDNEDSYYKLVEYIKVFNSPNDYRFIKYNYDIAYKSVIQNYRFVSKKLALRKIINNHAHLCNIHHDELNAYNDLECIFSDSEQIRKYAILISKFLDMNIGKTHQTFYRHNIHVMNEINKTIQNNYNVLISYEHYENRTVCNYTNI
ncbi:hypothetical protein AABD41_01495 [Staphylococcus pseudoxylosus]|uniref:hypothetical protein n=1 Tax=Staphylococcus pseudoxylosus TaxID=2282419 RepID=UPI00398B2E2A